MTTDTYLRTATETPRVTDLIVTIGGSCIEGTAEDRRQILLDALDGDEFDTKERITLAAVNLVLSQGVHAAPIDAIATQARVSKGAVFYTFGSRDKLIMHVLATLVDVLALSMAEARGGLRGREALEGVIREVLTLTVRNHAAVHTIFSEITRPDSKWGVTVAAMVKGVYQPLAEILCEIGLFEEPVSMNDMLAISFPSPNDDANIADYPDAQRLRVSIVAIVGAIFLVGQTLATQSADAAMIDAATNHLLELAQIGSHS
ncbi:TetR/AcrR family transcriptional regulator [Corynebacterium anserum]|uniref:TetR family transcriptional regulator n=1 Tax=Corynebacterium anserum TaxID=2684406 RepID=A0A7G7YLE6_9CORY|nr:TetR/AcrR family transcriptional regulator [Corynebacterium anserum]MBC2682533.1 TetR family transcriptional regulator [Corynebacterium anserum]QNH95316.1 TetR family transcriptional regulator [Corynebacterium anserum]